MLHRRVRTQRYLELLGETMKFNLKGKVKTRHVLFRRPFRGGITSMIMCTSMHVMAVIPVSVVVPLYTMIPSNTEAYLSNGAFSGALVVRPRQ